MAINVNRVKKNRCCQPIDEDLELDLFWHSIHRGPAAGDVYIGPNAMRYIFPEEGLSVRELRKMALSLEHE